ncbi:hypothetical protein SJAG_02967 [Schizosaccharomyces japonicus yFS275]|uniref:Uncharacterized protein n=1 Tax=Schizosaccharomyces japonicus (strain yFS275 / FY16936) TaxID=402676 RepID=B6K2Z0_SCHJY|nr:hypothetical protein SJAG_02967 [Schizosaccharomyces japonicus yFS275]EEB07847.1 hypothetical protein SJAG_02967 [Schizosaccharomyces japonicus yFS275]
MAVREQGGGRGRLKRGDTKDGGDAHDAGSVAVPATDIDVVSAAADYKGEAVCNCEDASHAQERSARRHRLRPSPSSTFLPEFLGNVRLLAKAGVSTRRNWCSVHSRTSSDVEAVL